MSKRVVFKDEGELGGQPYGPVFVYDEEEVEPEEEKGMIGRPYVRKCECAKPEGTGAKCEACDGEVDRYVTLEQAQAVAAEHRVELECV